MNDPVVIVGAGLSGLTAAKILRRSGVETLILESSDAVGGRARTDVVEGFKLDRGFQVFLTAYPEAEKHLDYPRLKLNRFEPGSLIWVGGQFQSLVDPWRRPSQVFKTAFSQVGSLSDKLRIALLRRNVSAGTLDDLFQREDQTSLAFLRDFGFSENMIKRFLRPFFGGVFLDADLETSCRMLYFVFRMFGKGDASLPTEGMGALSQQLAEGLPEDSLRLSAKMSEFDGNEVRLTSGEAVPYSRLLVATDQSSAAEQIPELNNERLSRSVTTLYFAAERSPCKKKMLILNGSQRGLINHLCVPSEVAPSYAPEGQALISITLLRHQLDSSKLISEVISEAEAMFGNQAQSWRHLRTDQIHRALPNQSTPAFNDPRPLAKLKSNLFVCGDYRTNGSINGAMQSGRWAAEEILRSF